MSLPEIVESTIVTWGPLLKTPAPAPRIAVSVKIVLLTTAELWMVKSADRVVEVSVLDREAGEGDVVGSRPARIPSLVAYVDEEHAVGVLARDAEHIRAGALNVNGVGDLELRAGEGDLARQAGLEDDVVVDARGGVRGLDRGAQAAGGRSHRIVAGVGDGVGGGIRRGRREGGRCGSRAGHQTEAGHAAASLRIAARVPLTLPPDRTNAHSATLLSPAAHINPRFEVVR
jgi:hypothetical protein